MARRFYEMQWTIRLDNQDYSQLVVAEDRYAGDRFTGRGKSTYS